ncbi:unnamed protein product [Rotaria magnacalcarata]|uniref:Alpha-type protein kinase domain-containing protein n=3 Tax=Rotaria magnacalcarata TaxID=392030 RepID=A0A815DDI0_9BILA|nr:unnamed protein product [Rotaria magnacalcarata]CAF1673293.1 unnamed protein product [Rotaria magnacalcarata]CAF2109261.1 unnamed protein product [Rotaria magnacalcarata]
MSMTGVTRNSEFNLDRHDWPPKGHLKRNRFVTQYEYLQSGGLRDVYLAKDTVTGQALVAKRFNQPGYSWSDDVELSQITQSYAEAFNEHLGYECVQCITPLIDGCTKDIGGPFQAGEKVIIEPCIGVRAYKKFNSNNGWHDEVTEEMAAFTHFTYNESRGRLIVCDLQGVKKSGGRFILTDPAICSLSQNYGATDMGEEGIRAFFANHTCNYICNEWKRHPRSSRSYHTQRRTSFR